jgi:hypothetical protein
MIAAKNIKFEYADNVASNVNKEQSLIDNIDHWFGESAEAINNQLGIIVVYFQNNTEQRISFDGIAEDLQAILYQKLYKFQPLHNRQPDSPDR